MRRMLQPFTSKPVIAIISFFLGALSLFLIAIATMAESDEFQ